MLSVTILLAVKILTLEEALKAAAGEPKPVALFFHEGVVDKEIDEIWEEILGERVGSVHIAGRDCSGDLDATKKKYALETIEGVVVFLDPGLEDGPGRVLDTFSPEAGEKADLPFEEIKKEFQQAVGDASTKWKRNEACRKALRAMWTALQKGDADGLKAVLDPAQVKQLSEADLKEMLKEGGEAANARPTLKFTAVEVLERVDDNDRMKVKFDMVDKDGKGDGTSFTVIRSEDGYFVVWEE